ncbi:hypothetical protein [Mangrovicoccus algicola]|uniref:Uncharacterized protein n=1 Tax=Mangrovicoccus algicola TaxID=2771008 RepID=A0A8J6YX16_9RHOB|nr:hypothetical protein [Mangrovicoccus algicola]MBE3637371.1 hypothetical protein [Mangrovicoccus algicola]
MDGANLHELEALGFIESAATPVEDRVVARIRGGDRLDPRLCYVSARPNPRLGLATVKFSGVFAGEPENRWTIETADHWIINPLIDALRGELGSQAQGPAAREAFMSELLAEARQADR